MICGCMSPVEICVSCHTHCQVCGILRHTANSLRVYDGQDLSILREQARGIHYYHVLLELLRVHFDPDTFCELIDLQVSEFITKG